MSIAEAMVSMGAAKDKGEARRLVAQRGVIVDDWSVADADAPMPTTATRLRIGVKRRWVYSDVGWVKGAP